MTVDPRTLGQNLYLIIGAVLLLVLLVSVTIVVWTAVKVAVWRRAQQRAAVEEERRRSGPDGRPYPPAGRGLCDQCHRVHEKVYHLPSGERRCPRCYGEPPRGSE